VAATCYGKDEPVAEIAVFHSVLGVRPGVLDAARRLTEAGHQVLVADLFEGEVFDEYSPAMHHAEEVIGHRELLARAARATAALADGMLTLGFSMGAAPAEYIALQRGAGTVLFAGAVPLIAFHEDSWPGRVAVQLHGMLDDPWREPHLLEAFSKEVRASGAPLEVHDYPGAGHLFTDASLAEEYDEAAAETAWARVLAFCAQR
jgi:dienelactone hydrolase